MNWDLVAADQFLASSLALFTSVGPAPWHTRKGADSPPSLDARDGAEERRLDEALQKLHDSARGRVPALSVVEGPTATMRRALGAER